MSQGKKTPKDTPVHAPENSETKPAITVHHSLMHEKPAISEDDGDKKEHVEREDLSHAAAPTLTPLDPSLSTPDIQENTDDQPKENEDEVQESSKETAPAIEEPEAKTDTPSTVENFDDPLAQANDDGPESAESKQDKAVPASKGTQKTLTEANDEAARAKHDAEVQNLITSKKYLLPIQTPEDRKTRRMIILGGVLALLLVIIWLDIALDAHIISLGSVKPVTHFFSN